jgi:hypothetical protein
MSHIRFIFLVAIAVMLSVTEARAYLDAGTGSMLVQLLLGGVAGLAVLAKLYWRRLTAMLGFAAADTAHSETHDERR